MNTTSARRAVLYARLSITKEESVSVTRQLESCRKYAEARGWEVVGEFVDDGVSATANRPEDRKGWAALLNAGGYDAVVIWKVDRLARRVLDFLHADEALRARGAGLVAVEDPIDMTSPQGRAFAVMLAVFGEMEAEAIRARVRAARAQLAKAGRFAGGGIPYGYRSIPNPDGPGRVLAKDPERNHWVVSAVRLAQEGATVWAVASWLTEQGAPFPDNRRTNRRADNLRWNHYTVDRLLKNPILAGMLPHNPGRGRNNNNVDPFAVVRDESGNPVVDESLAVITVAEFTELQESMQTRRTVGARNVSTRVTTSPLLSRVALCDTCEVYLCRGSNQKRPVLCCPKCRQTITRTTLDPYLTRRLLKERGSEPYGTSTVRQCWAAAGTDDLARREILLSQLDSLRIRRGVVGRFFDKDRVLLTWRPKAEAAIEHKAAS
jgi:site-specific DNA recombinase